MSVKKKFSPEEVEPLRTNRYTERVTAEQISFTMAFKEEFWRLSVEGCTGNMAFQKLGYDPEVLGFERVHNITKRIRRAARMPEGLKGKARSRMRISARRTSAAPSWRRCPAGRANGVFRTRSYTYSSKWRF